MSRYVVYRVMLQGEDGVYCQKDNILRESEAVDWIYKNKDRFGDGQYLFIEEYKNDEIY